MQKLNYLLIFLAALTAGCGKKNEPRTTAAMDSTSFKKGTFGYDLDFLKKHKDVILLSSRGREGVVIVKDYQGRVMTSTAGGDDGNSYGWINYDLIESGKVTPHIYPVGGEDRFWMGPEGGQYSIFFKGGTQFTFDNWQTPALIDSEPFELVSADSTQVTFLKLGSVTNYSGFTFQVEIRRQIVLRTTSEIETEFGISAGNLNAVGFESKNSITNVGTTAWQKKSGLLSIWVLGMLTPSDQTTVVIPYERAPDFEKKVTSNYFGDIPPDRISISDHVLFLKSDGRFRGKVGVGPSIAKPIAGSYDAARHVLTLVKFDVDAKGDYVNSKWETQKEPFKGDAVNAYNDGPLATGGQLGPFYELESSSPAKELKPGETQTHRSITVHLEGDESTLNEVALKTLGVSLNDITQGIKAK